MSRSDESVRRPSNGRPVFVMVGIDRPGGGVRLYASRDLPVDVGWGLRDVKTEPTALWHVDATMKNVLIIDKPTWGEAFARAFEIWENADRQKAIEAKEAGRVKAIEAARCEPQESSDFVKAVKGKVIQAQIEK